MRRILFFLAVPLISWAIPYEINFYGLEDQDALKALLRVSDVVTLQERPPASLNGLHYRMAADVPDLLRVLRAYGYYDATIHTEIASGEEMAKVSIFIHPGPQYTLSSYEVYHRDCKELLTHLDCFPITPQLLGLNLGAPALSVDIINAELNLLNQLSRCGYPLAEIEKRRVVVDMADKQVEAAVCIDEGPLSKFGPVMISGLTAVKPRLLLRKLAWKEGEIYSSDSIEETQKRLLNTNLFSTVMITHGSGVDEKGEIPIRLKVTEAKHRQVSLGVFYATVDGPGVSFHWTHRNVRGMGEIVSVDGDFSKRFLAGKLTYRKNDFLSFNQTYRSIAEISREDIFAYTAFTYGFSNLIDRKIDEKKSFAAGLEIKHVNVSQSGSNGTYLLAALPLLSKYNSADDLLNPTRGMSLVYQAIPFQSIDFGDQHFLKQWLTACFYFPIYTKRFVLASRFQFGSIAGARRAHIPLTELFLGGSEDDLRGYRYKTVSPLNSENQPLGGRSAIFISVETRIRFTETLGLVPFADFGTVSLKELPTVEEKWFKSLGIGLRYYTFFGPLRFDVGFPLDRRAGIDPAFRIYASIGQTF